MQTYIHTHASASAGVLQISSQLVLISTLYHSASENLHTYASSSLESHLLTHEHIHIHTYIDTYKYISRNDTKTYRGNRRLLVKHQQGAVQSHAAESWMHGKWSKAFYLPYSSDSDPNLASFGWQISESVHWILQLLFCSLRTNCTSS